MATYNIQGVDLEISALEDNGDYYAPQWFMSNDEIIGEYSNGCKDGAFEALVSFKNPMAALKEIGEIIVNQCRNADKPVFFVGSTEKRTKVYASMLKRAGINFVYELEPDTDNMGLRLIF
jgi:rhodanese-related sulfurtransferase